MAEQNPLFRKSAVDKLSSPERLDVAMAVTSPKGWLALLTIAAGLAGVIAWSILGSVPRRVDGEGILIGGGGLREIRATGTGVLEKFSLAVNGTVKPDQMVGEIRQVQQDEQRRTAEAQLTDAQMQANISNAENQATLAQNDAQIASLRADIGNVQAQIGSLEADLKNRREMLAKGLTTTARVQGLEQQILGLRGQVTSLESQINSLRAASAGIRQRMAAAAGNVGLARSRLQSATNVAAEVSKVTSTIEGRIIEVKKSQGDRVNQGEVLAIVEPPSATYEPVVYVDAAQGKLIGSGMEAQISPSTVKREEFGFMKGSVRVVSEYPVTPEAVMAAVANQSLATELLKGGSKLEVRARLVPNASTTSGFEWSSSGGPPFKVQSGTKVTLSVVVERRAPITFVMPMLRGMLGLS
jgi:HlyD family secretion protein